MTDLTPAIEIRDHINKALDIIEYAIKVDPYHVDYYVGLKEELLLADNTISFCIND